MEAIKFQVCCYKQTLLIVAHYNSQSNRAGYECNCYAGAREKRARIIPAARRLFGCCRHRRAVDRSPQTFIRRLCAIAWVRDAVRPARIILLRPHAAWVTELLTVRLSITVGIGLAKLHGPLKASVFKRIAEIIDVIVVRISRTSVTDSCSIRHVGTVGDKRDKFFFCQSKRDGDWIRSRIRIYFESLTTLVVCSIADSDCASRECEAHVAVRIRRFAIFLALLLALLPWWILSAQAHYPVNDHVHPINIQVGGCNENPTTASVHSLLPVAYDAEASVTRFEIYLSGRGTEFVVFRFSSWNLLETSRLVISAAGDTVNPRNFHQLDGTNRHSNVFFSPPLYATHIILEYFDGEGLQPFNASPGCSGFQIDQYRDRSLSEESIEAQSGKKHSRCPSSPIGSYSVTTTESVTTLAMNSVAYSKTLPVARILVQKSHGAVSCTGFFVGCGGHVLTNSHCVATEDEAAHTTIELSDPTSSSANQNFMMIIGASLVASSPVDDLDYALLLPSTDLHRRREILEQFGFLTLRSKGARLDERIYIPQFPGSSASNTEDGTHLDKQVAVKAQGRTSEGEIYGQITSVDTESCNGRNDSIGYSLYTSGGSSGAPVIAYTDHTVVGLHYCAAGCHKSAISSREIVQDLKRAGLLPPCAEITS